MTEDDFATEAAAVRDDYYARADSWARSRQGDTRTLLRVAWCIAAVATLVALFEAYALSALAPLKSVVPYTLLVDRTTGFVQVLKGDEVSAISRDEAATQAQLAQYVTAREAFDIAGVQGQYRKVALWSADRARSDYLTTIAAGNAQSPLRQLPRTSIVTVAVRSVSLMDGDRALVRFETERLDQGQVSGQRQAWVALVRYRYSGAPMAIEDRFINPLGFQVTEYRRDGEALLPERPDPSPSTIVPLGPQATRAPAAVPTASATRP